MNHTQLKQHIKKAIQQNAEEFKSVSVYIGQNPELGNEEYKASARLKELLAAHGFDVQASVLGIETSFIATYTAAKPGATVGLMCEYDALPEIGHACGHHLICMMSAGAAIGLKSVVDEIGGTIRVYGTPAEETRGAKVPMAQAGLFDDCDFAMMAHPYYAYEESGISLAMDALQFEFYGKSAHAAASPQHGINALDAVLQLFNGINAMRQQTRSDTRIHGIINQGGVAANIIPDYASAQFYIRSASRAYTNELVERVKRIAEGAALQTGCRVEISNYEYSYDELITNRTLSEAFSQNLIANGVKREEIQSGKDAGSLDLGNVSVRCPAIHPYVKVTDEKHELHSIGFRDRAQEPQALEAMLFTATVLAETAFDVMTNPALLEQIRSEFEQQMQRV
ncbi:M20 family metallopeptidase [Paenibacillus hunanensis]|uniref:Peptidase M20 domain-containing protein 2 n=1 Tax=Paenibacillus hunanensis TaxID=539262 RepID=A0ABU1J5P1_9BACL|nr:M20 family metallopeptidase [Paenibacillus hunanensis]MDR6246813.1 amidohydrolase [Paenibacillus hunanensis]GGJ32522.1 amidohydrolase [Paenibacillus hunanensis]